MEEGGREGVQERRDYGRRGRGTGERERIIAEVEYCERERERGGVEGTADGKSTRLRIEATNVHYLTRLSISSSKQPVPSALRNDEGRSARNTDGEGLRLARLVKLSSRFP